MRSWNRVAVLVIRRPRALRHQIVSFATRTTKRCCSGSQRRFMGTSEVARSAIQSTPAIQRPIEMDHAALSRIGFRQLAGSGEEVVNQSAGLARYLNAGRASSSQSRLNCTACHANEDPHSGQFGLSCVACHDTERWSIAAFRHPSPRSRDCAQCHGGPPCHRTIHFREVCAPAAGKPNAKVNECYSCHQSTAWNDIKGVGWYKSH